MSQKDSKQSYHFPSNFIWGTSTAATQIETAGAHEWNGLQAIDGSILKNTIAHELYRDSDAEIISDLAGSYRLSLDWSRLQTEPLGKFKKDVIDEYRLFIKILKERGCSIMMVCHHFTNPLWFSKNNGWSNKDNLPMFLDFVKQLVENFSDLVDFWNTFNEPMVYIGNAFLLGNFPPFKKNPIIAYQVFRNLALAHKKAYQIIKKSCSAPIGISKNTVWFYPYNVLGLLPSLIADRIFNNFGLSNFSSHLDFIGISYYAKVGFRPSPITYMSHPKFMDRKEMAHDMMWEYAPEGLERMIRRIWKKYKTPIFITENGIASSSSEKRIDSIKDYLTIIHQLISEGIDIRGYYHWSTFDNFEWHLGRSYTFGLVSVDDKTLERKVKDCGLFYKNLTKNNGF